MSGDLLIYADHEYCLIQYHKTKLHRFAKLTDKLNKLQNIIPKSIYSRHNQHCIVDINNVIHLMYFEASHIPGTDIVVDLRLDVGKSTFDDVQIFACRVDITYGSSHRHVLLKNMRNNGDQSYEYFMFAFERNIWKYTCHEVLDNNCLVYNINSISIKVGNKVIYFTYGVQINRFRDLNGCILPEIKNKISRQHTKTSNYKYGFDVSTSTHPKWNFNVGYSFLVDDSNCCYIKSPLANPRKICTLIDDSIVLCYCNNFNNDIIIVNTNSITILNDHVMMKLDLPVKYIYHAANSRITDLVW